MIDSEAEVLVLGAGVIGLTTAICLAESGVTVTVAGADPPGRTTSAAAGAIWGPHLVGEDDRIGRWAAVTLERLLALSGQEAGADRLDGVVRTVRGVAASREEGADLPGFAADSADIVACAASDRPAGYRTAWRLTGTTIAMPGYLDYLVSRLNRAGGNGAFPVRKISSLNEAGTLAPRARVIVNCTGTGARELVPDPDVIAVRGQVVLAANPGITEFFVGTSSADPADLTYLFPHGELLVLGGTEQTGDWSTEPDPATAERIIAACAAIEPVVSGAEILGHRVGLRPARPSVRLEAEQHGPLTVVHNYGHGGAGVTLSWGCALDAAALALAELG